MASFGEPRARTTRLHWGTHMFKRAAVVAVLAISSGSCSILPAFAETGTGNGSSRTFHLSAGTHRITFDAADREPFTGCNFGISFESPGPDPLAPGRVITSTAIMRIEPRGRLDHTLVTPDLADGDYAIDYLGDVPCDWTVTVN